MSLKNPIAQLRSVRKKSRYGYILLAAIALGILLLVKWSFGYHLIIERPAFLWLLLFSPLAWLAFNMHLQGKEKRLSRLADEKLIASLTQGVDYSRFWRSFFFFQIALLLVVIGSSGPRYGTKPVEAFLSRAELMVAIDVSKSMLAEDVSPNRLEQAKQIVAKVSDELANDRIGLIVFAGSAYVQMPLTDDLFSTRVFLNSISDEVVPRQGTALATAVELATESFPEDAAASRSLLIITDGEDHEDGVSRAMDKAVDAGLDIALLGVGTKKGAPIPDTSRGGRQYKKSKSGSIIVSHLEEAALEEMASDAGATLLFAGDRIEIDELNRWIAGLQRSGEATIRYTDKYHLYPFFFLTAALLLMLEIWTRKGQ